MQPAMQRTCAQCRRELSPGEGRPVAKLVKVAAAAALAFMHGGMWAHEELSRDYCERCRRRMTATALGISLVIFFAASIGVAIWLRGPSLR